MQIESYKSGSLFCCGCENQGYRYKTYGTFVWEYSRIRMYSRIYSGYSAPGSRIARMESRYSGIRIAPKQTLTPIIPIILILDWSQTNAPLISALNMIQSFQCNDDKGIICWKTHLLSLSALSLLWLRLWERLLLRDLERDFDFLSSFDRERLLKVKI